MRVPFETPLHWTIIQIGLSTDLRYMTCRVSGTHGLYAVQSCCPAALHSPGEPALPPTVSVRALMLMLVSLRPGHQPNGIVHGQPAPGQTERSSLVRCSVSGPFGCCRPGLWSMHVTRLANYDGRRSRPHRLLIDRIENYPNRKKSCLTKRTTESLVPWRFLWHWAGVESTTLKIARP